MDGGDEELFVRLRTLRDRFDRGTIERLELLQHVDRLLYSLELHELGARCYVLGVELMQRSVAITPPRAPIIPGRQRRFPPAFNPAWLSAAARAAHRVNDSEPPSGPEDDC